jgi:hypothetical protein
MTLLQSSSPGEEPGFFLPITFRSGLLSNGFHACRHGPVRLLSDFESRLRAVGQTSLSHLNQQSWWFAQEWCFYPREGVYVRVVSS